MALLPLFVVRCRGLFRRTVAAYAAALVGATIVFAVYPVSSETLRVPASVRDGPGVSLWAISQLYRWDPPYNLFPSLHVAVALLAAGAAWKVSKAYGAAALALAVPIGVSILTVKQHFIWDGVAGALLAAAAYGAIIRPYRRPVPR